MVLDWKTLPAMQPYVQALPMATASGESRVPHSCSTFNNLTVLTHCFTELNPQRTLEIGLGFGASAALLLSLHQRSGGEGREHHAIDAFQDTDWGNAALMHLQASGLDSGLRFHGELSSVVLPRLVAAGEKFGLIYVDGSHLFEDVLVDFYFSHQLLQTGGTILFDDCTCPHVAKVIAFIRRNMSADYVEHSPYAITAPRHARLKQIAARVLNRQQLTLFHKRAHTPRSWATPLVRF